MSFATTRKNLEEYIIFSEGDQAQKDEHCMTSLISGI
jgi:hypothetical protein